MLDGHGRMFLMSMEIIMRLKLVRFSQGANFPSGLHGNFSTCVW